MNITNGKREHRLITVKEFLTYKPTHEQTVQGKIKVIPSQVAKLRPKVRESLRNGQMPISAVQIGKSIHIIAGHHRQEAARQEVEAGKLDASFTFEVTFEAANPTKAELSALVARAGGTLTRSKALIHAAYGFTDISVKVIGPIFDALRATKLNERMALNLAGKLGGILNNNKVLVKDLAEGRFVNVSGPDLYKAKGYIESGAGFLDAQANVDLRPLKNLMTTRFSTMAGLVEELRSEGTWREKLGNSQNLIYTLAGLSLRNQLVEGSRGSDSQVATGKITKAIQTEGRKLHKAITKYNAGPEAQEDTILKCFGLSK